MTRLQSFDTVTRWGVWFLLGVALAVQLGYALTNDAPPIWDETGHARAANSLLEIHSWDELAPAVRASLRYGIVYPLWLASVYGASGGNYFLARIMQGVIAVALLAFLYLAARETFGKRAGLLTLACGVLYLPFVSTAARLLSETFAMFWFACALWLLARGLKRGSMRALFLAGMTTVLTGLTRPTLQLLFMALGIGVVVALWGCQQPLRRVFFYIAGTLALLVPFLLFTYLLFGRATLSGTVNPAEGIFVGNYIPDGGYPTDARSFDHAYPQPEFANVRAEKRAPTASDFARVTIQVARQDPAGLMLLQARKLYDQWRAPFNDFEISFGIPYTFQIVWHAIIILLGAVGAIVFFRRQPLTRVWVVGWLYIIFTNLLVPVERRYAFPGILVALLLAGGMLDLGINVITRREKFDRTLGLAIAAVALGAVLLFGIFNLNRPTETRVWLAPNARAQIAFQIPADSRFTDAAFYVDGTALAADSVRAEQAGKPISLQMQPNDIFQNATYAQLLQRQGKSSSELPQWFRFVFDPNALSGDSPLVVSITGPAALTRKDNAAKVRLPALDSLKPNSNTSLYKYLADGDYRIPRALSPDATIDTEGSPYRVLLRLTRDDGKQIILW